MPLYNVGGYNLGLTKSNKWFFHAMNYGKDDVLVGVIFLISLTLGINAEPQVPPSIVPGISRGIKSINYVHQWRYNSLLNYQIHRLSPSMEVHLSPKWPNTSNFVPKWSLNFLHQQRIPSINWVGLIIFERIKHTANIVVSNIFVNKGGIAYAFMSLCLLQISFLP